MLPHFKTAIVSLLKVQSKCRSSHSFDRRGLSCTARCTLVFFLGIGTMHAKWVVETLILHWSPVCRQKILASGSIGLCQLTRARLTSIATPIRRSITNSLDFRQFGGKTWFLQGLPLRGILLGKRQGLGLAWELVLLIILEQKLKECWQFFPVDWALWLWLKLDWATWLHRPWQILQWSWFGEWVQLALFLHLRLLIFDCKARSSVSLDDFGGTPWKNIVQAAFPSCKFTEFTFSTWEQDPWVGTRGSVGSQVSLLLRFRAPGQDKTKFTPEGIAIGLVAPTDLRRVGFQGSNFGSFVNPTVCYTL